MKAIWEYDHQILWDEMEYANYLDFINEKLRVYDDDYASRLIHFKAKFTTKAEERNLTAEDRTRNDKDSLLRQARAESLWKGLRRLINLRLSSKFEDPQGKFEPENDLNPCEESMIRNLVNATDKYEAAIALQPEAAFPVHHSRISPVRQMVSSPGGLVSSNGEELNYSQDRLRIIFLTARTTLRRILNFKESIMKYGIFVPRNDHEADNSPERLRWDSGRQLEWMRLRDQGTFERNWD
jgi:hypothetical protein